MVVTNQWGSVTSSVAALTVEQAAPVVTWAAPAPITYGAALTSAQLNATASVPGSFIYAPVSRTVLNAGSTNLSVVFTPTDTIDYSKATNSVSLVVLPAGLTISANNQTKMYGQSITFTGNQFSVGGLVNGNTVSSVSLASAGSSATATVANSPYTIVPAAAAGTGLANYTIAYVNGLLTVNSASLTVTANNQSKIYGKTLNFSGTEFSASGLVNGDSVARVAFVSAGSLATATVAGSPYSIVPSAAVGTGLGNYVVSHGDGAMTVSPAPLTVTASNQTKTYGQTVSFAGTEFTTSGLQNSDAVNSVVLTSSGAKATATVGGSPYTIALSTAAGTGLNNYTIAYDNGTLTVKPASLTVTADNQTKNYGQLLTFAGAEFITQGLLNADAVSSVTLTSPGAATNATVAGSPYPIVPSAAVGSGLINYTISYADGILTISPANARPVIQSATLAGKSFTFTWSATATEMYQVQFTTNLYQSAWLNFGNPITASNSTATASDSITNARRFYRVTVLP